jgi:hypothetical protein
MRASHVVNGHTQRPFSYRPISILVGLGIIGLALLTAVFFKGYFEFATAPAHVGDRDRVGDGNVSQGSANDPAEIHVVGSYTGVPLRIRALVRPLFAKDSPEAVCICRVLQQPPRGQLSVSYCCHLLRLYGLDGFRHSRFGSGREVVDVLTDQKLSETWFGEPMFFQTRNGLRYRSPKYQKFFTGENHRDICLATFAELGLPLTTPMTGLDESFSLRDLLRDSVENFDIKQKELPWTTVAFALYLPPRRGWTNRYRESFTFDDLANALMETPLDKGSCGGAHLVYAMTILWRADFSVACLSESVRDALARSLRQRTVATVESQAKEGYWTLDWHVPGKATSEARRSPREMPDTRLVATGHLLEWLEMLPVEFQPSQDVYRRAARWLCAALEKRLQVTSFAEFCPCIHATCAVRALIGEVGE